VELIAKYWYWPAYIGFILVVLVGAWWLVWGKRARCRRPVIRRHNQKGDKV